MVIRIPNWLGDAIMATPVYYNISQKEKIYLFGPKEIVDLFENFPNTQIIYYERNNFKKNLELLMPLKNEVGLLLTNSFSSAWLFFRASLKERWGYAKDLRSFLLTKAIKPPPIKLHQRDYYLYLLKKLDLPYNFKDLFLPLDNKIFERTKAFLGNIVKKSFIVIAPGAAYGPAKMWPKEYYKDLTQALIKKGIIVLIVGGQKEKEIGDFIKGFSDKVYNLCGKTDLITVAGIFYFSKGVISNDSGLMHLASALKIPQIAIFGSTDPFLTGPLNSKAIVLKKSISCSPCFKRTCKYGHYQCLKSINVEEVMEALENLIF